MAKKKRSARLQGVAVRYLVAHAWPVGGIIAAGVCICLVFNLMSRHGVLAPESGGKQGKSSVRPLYGVSSTSSAAENSGSKHHSSVRNDLNNPPVAATAVVLVRNHPEAGATATRIVESSINPVQEGPAQLVVISLAEATKYNESRSAIFVDARSAQRFAMGHVPGAMNVPSSDFDKGYERNGPRLPKDGKIIVYCESASCDQAEDVANKLIGKGYRRVMHFKDGWLVWEFSDQIQEKGGEQ